MADSQVLKALSPDNPLCGISTYKDTLNLATGACTRQIYKLVLHGTESYGKNVTGTYQYYMAVNPLHKKVPICVCSHLPSVDDYPADVIGVHTTRWANNAVYLNFGEDVMLAQPSGNTVDGLKEYITAQYNAGTPVTIWYIMETSTTETIPVPSGLSGTEEGYLNQSGTPTPTNPIYPTANNVEVWLHSLRKLTTATDTITTLPANLYADGNNATVGLKGNMSQTGTPTPQNPIQPQETGERTGNLFDINTIISISKGTIANGIITSSVINANYDGVAINLSLPIAAGTYYVSASIRLVSGEAITMNKLQLTNTGASITTITNPRLSEEFKRYCYKNDISSDRTATQIYFQLGENISNAVIEIKDIIVSNVNADYEPYGYKIPISSNSTTIPVYLGEVETTRKIKKLLLTGEENWNYSATSQAHWIANVPNDYDNTLSSQITTVCTHYKCIRNDTGIAGTDNNDLRLYARSTSPVAHELYIKDETYTSAADFKTYLQQQYAAGTPVTVWYVLATPETAIVNEPLRKIGDYADTVSGVTVPTTGTAEQFDVLTTLKPSEVSLTYTGWHDATVKEWDGSEWQ